MLFGSSSVEKVLIFLFVNRKCYGSQLQKLLKTALTPIQKALKRLEEDGVITSYLVGKTKFYQFNPSFPLLDELQQLLRKAFTLLPPHDQQQYYAKIEGGYHCLGEESIVGVLQAFWKKLSLVRNFSLIIQDPLWTKEGKGEVNIVKEKEALIFHEKGEWEEPQVRFSNTYRWTLNYKTGTISLEHLRLSHPIFLLRLTPIDACTLASIDSNLAAQDTYFGKIQAEKGALHLKWRVIGANKNQEIRCIYRKDS